jgi:hypothetical protein
MKKWYCYLCGKTLLKNYYLVSMKKSTDRVFLVCEGCRNQVDDDHYSIKIKEI